MRVFKFGGASVKNSDAVRNVGRVLVEETNGPLLVVISAMGKMTNKMEDLVDAYYYNKPELKTIFDEIKTFHEGIVNDLIEGENDYFQVDNLLVELECIVGKTRNADASFDEEYDRIVPFGELLSTTIVNTYLNKINYKSRWIDARNFVITTDKNRAAKVLWDESVPLIQGSLKPLVERQTIITQGFIGSGLNHKPTTLGREGSDYSAAIFAYALDADSVTIWKDVAGVMNGDPKRFDDAVLIPQLSYNEAIELAYYGASIIHPKTIQPLKNKDIPLFVKSFIHTKDSGSQIMESDQRTLNETQCYIVKDDQSLVTISSKDFSFIVEDNLEIIFNALNTVGIQLNLMQNSAISFMGCFNGNHHRSERLKALLEEDFNVSIEEDYTMLTIFNYNEDSSKLGELIAGRDIKLEQRSQSALQLVLANN